MHCNKTKFKALTLTSLEKKISLPPDYILSHDVDKKVQQYKDLALKSVRYRDISCDCDVCVKLAAKAVDPILRRLLLECIFIDLSDSKQEFRDHSGGGALLVALVNFSAVKADIDDLEVYLKPGGGQIAVSVKKGETIRLYNACPDIVIKKRDNVINSFVGMGEVESSPIMQSYITSLGYISRESKELVLSIILYKSKTIDLFIMKNLNNMIDGHVGPIEMFKALPNQYNLITESSIKELIKHLGAILSRLCDQLKTEMEPEVLSETSESSETCKDLEPPKKKQRQND